MKLFVNCNARAMQPSATKDCVPITQESCVVCESSFRSIVIQPRNKTYLKIQTNPDSAKQIKQYFSDHWAIKIIYSFKCFLKSLYIKIQNPVLCRQKEFM